MLKGKKVYVYIILTTLTLLFLALTVKAKDYKFGKPFFFNNSYQTLKFAQVTDVHLENTTKDISRRLLADSPALITDVVDQLNATKNLNFTVFSGDSINSSKKSNLTKFLSISSKLNTPWYMALGNHDIGILGGISKNNFLAEINKFSPNFTYSKSYYSFTPQKGYLFIIMDGVIDNAITAHGFFPKDELNWLESQLKNNPESKVFIVQHFPLIEPSPSNDHSVKNAEEYLTILNKYKNVKALLAGHYHVTRIIKTKNFVQVSTPALVQYPNAFRVYTISEQNGKTTMKIELKETGLKTLQEKSKSRSNADKSCYGKPSDRDATIVLN